MRKEQKKRLIRLRLAHTERVGRRIRRAFMASLSL